MAEIDIYYPGSDDHPVEEANVARGLDFRAFRDSSGNPIPEPMPDGAVLLADWTQSGRSFVATSMTLTLPDGTTFTPTGAGIPQTTADTRYFSFLDPSVPGNPRLSASERTQARQNLSLGDISTRDASDFDLIKAGTPDYVTASGRTITVNEIDLTTDVSGALPIANINSNELNQRIVQQAATVGTVHRFADMAAFMANTETWQVGDILIIGTTVYLFTGTNGASTNIADFTMITVPGGGISQATADGRYLQTSNNLSEFTDPSTARMNLGLGNSAVLSVGAAPNTVAAGDHNHDERYPRIDVDDAELSGTQLSNFLSNVQAFEALAAGGIQIMDFTALIQTVYALGEITAQRTVTLPGGTQGHSVYFVNISTFNANNPGERIEGRPLWRIVPATGERINGLALNEELLLDNTVANFKLTYTDADTGWVIL